MIAGGAATATACKVAAVVCATAITAGGAVEVRNLARDDGPAKQKPAAAEKARHAGKAAAATAAVGAASAPVLQHEITRAHSAAATAAAPAAATRERHPAGAEEQPISSSYADPVDIPVPVVDVDAPVAVDDHAQAGTGGTIAPAEPDVEGDTTNPPVTELPDETAPPAGDGTTTPPPAEEPAPPPTGTTPLPQAH